MKKVILLALFAFIVTTSAKAQNQETIDVNPQFEVKVITSVESIVPLGMGRSRLISSNAETDYAEFTSSQTEDDNTRNKSKRKNVRSKEFDETKLLNFYNVAGIRFQNIASNDAIIASKLTAMLAEGWDLVFVTSAVESDAGTGDGNGIFITRYIFKRKI